MNGHGPRRAAVLLIVAMATLARAETPPADAPAAPTDAAPPPAWGPPSGGLAAALVLEGDAGAGGRLVFRLALKSAAGQSVPLGPADKAFGWVVIAQNIGEGRRVFYSEKVRMTAAAGWTEELAGDAVLSLGPFDLGAAKAYDSKAARPLLTAYLSEKADEPLPEAAGILGKALEAGQAMAKFTLCLPREAGRPLVVTSAGLPFAVSPPDLAALKPEAREAFLADLMKQFDRDPWSGQQAHDTCVRLGQEVLPRVLQAAAETQRPAHARLWLATTLADIADPRAAEALARLLEDPLEGVRYVVAYHGPKQRSDRLDRAIVAAAKAPTGAPRLPAWALLGFLIHRKTVPEEVLKAGLESDDPRARATAAEALAQHAGDENVARLAALLEDPDERVRGTAAAVLGKSGRPGPRVLAALVKALDLPGETARQRVATALSELAGRNVPYDPAADAATRARAVADWKAWWADRSGKP